MNFYLHQVAETLFTENIPKESHFLFMIWIRS